MRIAYHCTVKTCGTDFMLDAPTPVPGKAKKERPAWEGAVAKAVADHHKTVRPKCAATAKDFDIMLPIEAQS